MRRGPARCTRCCLLRLCLAPAALAGKHLSAAPAATPAALTSCRFASRRRRLPQATMSQLGSLTGRGTGGATLLHEVMSFLRRCLTQVLIC